MKNKKPTMPVRRNAIALIAKTQFRAVSFKHKAEDRGGTNNDFADYMTEYSAEQEENFDD